MEPKDEIEMKEMFECAPLIRTCGNTLSERARRYSTGILIPQVSAGIIQMGEAEVPKDGKDVALIALVHCLPCPVGSAETRKRRGFSDTVNARRLNR
jgi:hypothetical protein